MPRCTFKNTNGNVCNQKSDKLEYVLLYDPHQRINLVKYGCPLHMNLIIDDLMVEQIGHEKHMKAILKQIEKKNEELHKGTSVAEERQKIRDAKADGLQEPKLKKTEELKAELKSMWESVRNIKKILQLKRNKYCVYCAFQLHDPEFPQDQIGITYANADFKGVQGYRRFDALFHTECFITWYANKFHLDDKEMQYVQPLRIGQTTIFSSIEENN